MKKILLFFCLGCSFSAFAQTQIDFFTSKGDFRVKVREDLMPITAGNFIDLVQDGFYDGLIFHRVVAGFVIQGGDPSGNGSGGPGYTIMDEYNPLMHHDSAGVLAMAKTSAPNSAGSQFYFTLAPQPSLNVTYAVFGSCIQGLDVIKAIGSVAVQGNDKPWINVYMDSLRVVQDAVPTKTAVQTVKTEVFPNPFSAQTTISYQLKKGGPVELDIYNAQGRLVQSLVNETKTAGIHSIEWDGTDVSGAVLPEGIYLLTLKSAEGMGSRKLVKLR